MSYQNSGLSPSELAHFQSQGYVIVEDIYDAEAMQSLKQHAIDMCLDPKTPEENIKWNAKARAEPNKYQGAQALHSFWRPHTISEQFRAICSDPKLTQLLASILGPNVITFNGLTIFKSREIGLAFPYHQDMWYFSKSSEIAQSCAIWLALDDADEENGCLWIVPESHTGKLYDHVEPAGEYNQQEFREVLEARDMAEISVPLRAGSALFFDGRLLHRSGLNQTDRDRTCYVIHNTSADTRFGSQPGSLEYRATMRTRGNRDPQFLS
ncbi:MAG: phytanoyl-CoA dioxygenase family protein [Chloroflexota bacterium]